MAVRFLKSYHRYNEGEVAGFSKEHEDWLCKRKIAEQLSPASAPKEGDVKAADKQTTTGGGKKTDGPVHRQTTVSSK